MSDTVTLPSGQVITRGRAQALGLLDDDGNIKSSVPADSAAAQVLEQDARRIAWDKQQGIAGELAAIEAERERVRLALGGEPQVTEDGLPIEGVALTRGQKAAATRAANAAAKAALEPLRPRNVDKTGAEVTDPEVLAKIAADVAALEAAKLALVTPEVDPADSLPLASGLSIIEAGPGDDGDEPGFQGPA